MSGHRPARLTAEVETHIRDARARFLSWRDIAGELHVNPCTVRDWGRWLGISARLDVAAPARAPMEGRVGSEALPPMHPFTWGLIVGEYTVVDGAGTSFSSGGRDGHPWRAAVCAALRRLFRKHSRG